VVHHERFSVSCFPHANFLAIFPRKNDLCGRWFTPRCKSIARFLCARTHDRSHSQTAKNIVASHDTLVNLFERVQFFLQRLNIYNGIPLTTDMMELIGKVMAQILLILALSTKEMNQNRFSQSLQSTYLYRLTIV
jgi:hypothetical protein